MVVVELQYSGRASLRSYGGGEVLGRGGLRLGGWCGCPPLTPLFIRGREKGAVPLELI